MNNHPKKKQTLSYLPILSYYTFFNTFISWYRFLQKSATWNQKKTTEYQSNTLQKLINHAYHHVPYYHTLFKKKRIKPTDITIPDDLSKIPILTKDIIREQNTQIKATNYPKNAFHPYHTGGTTGTPLSFYIESSRWLGIHFAFNKTYMHSAGYQSYDKVISFAGTKQPITHHPLYRTIELSSFHTTTKDFDQYYHHIQKFNPRYITTFPSAIILFTHDRLNQKKDLNINLKAIFCHGEQLPPKQKRFLEETYDCPVLDQYGHREQCVYATTCPTSNLFHVYPHYGIAELLDENEQTTYSKGKTGEIVATSLINNVFPLIRYKTEDRAQLTNDTCSCGNHTTFFHSILGRTQEFIIGKNQEKIPVTGLYHLCTNQQRIIRDSQIIQEKEGELIISIITTTQWNTKDEKQLQKRCTDLLGNHFTCTIQPVESIQRTPHGKQRFLIQKLPIATY